MGEAAALLSAFSWSCTSIALVSLSSRTAPAVLSALRLFFGSIVLVVLLLLTGDAAEYGDAKSSVFIGLIVSGLCGYALGDTLYIRALSQVGLQRAFPVVQALFILLSVGGGILLLDESAGIGLIGGTVFIAIGIYLVVTRTSTNPGPVIEVPHVDAVAMPAGSASAVVPAAAWKSPSGGKALLNGYWLLPVVALLWATATILLAKYRGDLGAISAGTLRTPAGAVGLLAVTMMFQRDELVRPFRKRSHIGLIAVAGILGTAFGSLLYVYSVIEAGAARAVVLNATAPLMAVPLAVIFLGERFSRRIASGTALCVGGIILVVAL